MELNFYSLSVLYLVYSFLGWVGETVVATIKGRRFANRGVASGPFCFIYGFTAVLLAISFVCFVFINLIPSNPAEVVLRIQQTPIITDEAIAEMEEALGLNKPFLVRYFDWVLGCLQGDFGISYVNPARTVAGELARCLPATLQLAAASFVIVLLLSIPIGFLCAVYKDGWFDKIMRGLVFISTAMPAYWDGDRKSVV